VLAIVVAIKFHMILTFGWNRCSTVNFITAVGTIFVGITLQNTRDALMVCTLELVGIACCNTAARLVTTISTVHVTIALPGLVDALEIGASEL